MIASITDRINMLRAALVCGYCAGNGRLCSSINRNYGGIYERETKVEVCHECDGSGEPKANE